MNEMLCQLCHRRRVEGSLPLLDPRTFEDVYTCTRCRTIGNYACSGGDEPEALYPMDEMDWYVWFDALAAKMYQKTDEYKQRQRAWIEKRMRAGQRTSFSPPDVEQTSSINERGIVVERYGTVPAEQPKRKLNLID